jgi:hypothetical protein
MRASRYGSVVVLLAVAFLVCGAGDGVTAVTTETLPSSKRAFQVLPAEHPKIGFQRRLGFELKRPIIVRPSKSNAHIRQGFIRSVALACAGLIGLGFLGLSLYGGLQGRFWT